MNLSSFRNELDKYLRLQSLDRSIPGKKEVWANFLTYYARVIEDCPLKCKASGLKFTEEVVVRVLDIAPDPHPKKGFRRADPTSSKIWVRFPFTKLREGAHYSPGALFRLNVPHSTT